MMYILSKVLLRDFIFNASIYEQRKYVIIKQWSKSTFVASIKQGNES